MPVPPIPRLAIRPRADGARGTVAREPLSRRSVALAAPRREG
jgi:hypothetical protein